MRSLVLTPEARDVLAFIRYNAFAQKLGRLSRSYTTKSLAMAVSDLIDSAKPNPSTALRSAPSPRRSSASTSAPDHHRPRRTDQQVGNYRSIITAFLTVAETTEPGSATRSLRVDEIARGHAQPCIDQALLRRLAELILSLRR